MGLALTPAGGSVCMRLKSRIRRLLAAVDMAAGVVVVVVVVVVKEVAEVVDRV